MRFEDYDNLKAWQESRRRVELVEKSEEMTIGDPNFQEAHGLESWFTLPDRQTSVSPPAKYKMAVLTVAAIYPLILLVGAALSLPPQELPPLISTLIAVIVVGTSMTYFVMPWITRRFRFWLFPSPGS
jgi:antibiotic biosynthesis monooxygenase (ABM) superfamily enzyme